MDVFLPCPRPPSAARAAWVEGDFDRESGTAPDATVTETSDGWREPFAGTACFDEVVGVE
jgi:hypothetical protein